MTDQTRRRRRGYGAAVLLVGLTMLLATPALAATTTPKPRKSAATVISVQSEEGGIAPASVKTVDVKCPTGFDVIGGSYLISGAVFAHAVGAAPFWSEHLYSAVIANPPTSAFVKAQDASVTVVAECAVTGRPLVVDGPFASAPGGGGPSRARSPLPGTITSVVAHQTVANGDEGSVKSSCGDSNLTAIGGGYTLGGSLWAASVGSVVLSKVSSYGTNVVNPKFNPALGVTDASVRVGVAALCSRSGQVVVPNAGTVKANGYEGTPRGVGVSMPYAAAAAKPKLKPGTIVIKTEKSAPIPSGDVQSALAACPAGYSIFGGGYLIGGDSVLAHASDAAVLSRTNRYVATVVNPPANINTGTPKSSADVIAVAECAKSGVPVVANGSFGLG